MKKIHLFKVLMLTACTSLTLSLSSCCNKGSCSKEETKVCQADTTHKAITLEEVTQAQAGWGDGIVEIGKCFEAKGDYKKVAEEHIKKFYDYAEGQVLFKPTLASVEQFRPTFEGALSYFVADNKDFPEDHGFAIKPWSKVRFENHGVIFRTDCAIAMGNYFFTPSKGGDEVKVEYTFVYHKDKNGDLKIILHGSHLPYTPKAH